jgi:hypothetical protein
MSSWDVLSISMHLFIHSLATLLCTRFSLLIVFSSILAVSAGSVNVTVDDSQSAIRYTPAGLWKPQSDCSTCHANPDPAQAFSGTWHDCSYIQGDGQSNISHATLQFEGTHALQASIFSMSDMLMGAVYRDSDLCILHPCQLCKCAGRE